MSARTEPIIRCSVQPEGSPLVRLDESARILALDYTDEERRADRLILTVDNYDLRNFDDPVWRKGGICEVSWGYPEQMAPPRRMQVRKVAGFQELRVEAHGLEVLLNLQPRSRVWNGVRRSDVARQIAAENGFVDDSQLHVEDTEEVLDHVTQAQISDALMLRRLAHAEGFEWFVDFDGFHFHQRDLAQDALRTVRYFGEPDRSEMHNVQVENDVTGKPGTVRARTRNPTTRRTIDVLASHETETGRPVLGQVQELPGTDQRGVPGFRSIAREAVQATTQQTEGSARRAAAARFRRAQHVAVKISFDVEGDPLLLAKSVVQLEGLGKRLSGRYYVRTVRHRVGRGYVCSVTCVSDGSGGHSTRSQVAAEASAIQVGPAVRGRRGRTGGPTVRRTIDVTPEVLRTVRGTDREGNVVVTHQQARRAPPRSS